MTFEEIYNLTIKYYPNEIDISDGKILPKDGGVFMKLSKFWDNAELQTENESDFVKLMVWVIFCAYHKRAIENFQNDKMVVFLSELDKKYLKNKFEESLNNYPKLKAKYIQSYTNF